MATASLTPTFGIWLISVFLESILYGTGMLQIFLYFQWYPKDLTGIKVAVLCLMLVESTQLALFYYGTYFHIIEGFTNPELLLSVIWVDSIQLLFLYLSAILVQLYFTYCIFKFASLAKSTKAVKYGLTLAICILVLLELGAGIAQVVQTQQVSSFLELSSAKNMTSLQSATALCIDLMITISLVVILGRSKGEISQTNSMIDKLVIYAINRGFLTAACALFNLIMFLALPGTFYFFLGLVTSSKLYMNSMMATLNTRQHIRRHGQPSSGVIDWNSILTTENIVRPVFPSGQLSNQRQGGTSGYEMEAMPGLKPDNLGDSSSNHKGKAFV